MIDVVKSRTFLPHSYPFLLVTGFGNRAGAAHRGAEKLTANEEFFQGHFPGSLSCGRPDRGGHGPGGRRPHALRGPGPCQAARLLHGDRRGAVPQARGARGPAPPRGRGPEAESQHLPACVQGPRGRRPSGGAIVLSSMVDASVRGESSRTAPGRGQNRVRSWWISILRHKWTPRQRRRGLQHRALLGGGPEVTLGGGAGSGHHVVIHGKVTAGARNTVISSPHRGPPRT